MSPDIADDYPERVLDENPDITIVAFAGKMAQAGVDPERAMALYDEAHDGERADEDDDQDDDDEGEDTIRESEKAMARDVEENSELYEALADEPDEEDAGAAQSDEDESGGVAEGSESEADESESEASLDIGGHYERVAPVYEELGSIGEGTYATGCHDFTGWYKSRSAEGHADGTARPWVLAREFDEIREHLDRVAYGTINYADAEFYLDAWDTFEWGDGGREWSDGTTPQPGYEDLLAYAPYADIDIESPLKYDREKDGQGDVPVDAIETATERYIDAFGELAGGREHVFALDSVGGVYVFVAPTATHPIALEFEPEDRAVIFDALTDRLNSWLMDVAADIADEVPAVEGVFEPDEVNHKNRLYKLPMSLHKSMDGVVTPIETDDPQGVSYDFTPADGVTDEMVDDCVEWARDFTAPHHVATDGIVRTLFADEYGADDVDGWADALQKFLDKREAIRREAQEREEMKPQLSEIPDDLDTTDDIEVINTIVENIDVADVARQVCVEWDTDPGRTPKRFEPSWRPSSSGTSCYADSDKYVDLVEGKNGGGALKLAARAAGIITHSRDSPTGDDYWRAINELRKLGYDIPRFEGYNGKHADVLELYDDPDDEEDEARQVMREIFS